MTAICLDKGMTANGYKRTQKDELYFAKKCTGLYLVMDFFEGGSLDKHVLETEADYKRVFRGMLKGIEYMHRHGVVHRDLKAENVLYCKRERRVAIADLGAYVYVVHLDLLIS